jgi:hypothetical protein
MCAIIPTFRMREVLILPIVLECIDRLPGNRVDFANLVSIPGHCFSIYPRFRIRNISSLLLYNYQGASQGWNWDSTALGHLIGEQCVISPSEAVPPQASPASVWKLLTGIALFLDQSQPTIPRDQPMGLKMFCLQSTREVTPKSRAELLPRARNRVPQHMCQL